MSNLQQIKVKNSQKLFNGVYRYKTVIICPVAAWFRGNNTDHADQMLKKYALDDLPKYQCLNIKNPTDYLYSVEVLNLLKSFSDYDLRIEQPLLSFYTNHLDSAVTMANLDVSRTKYMCGPPDNVVINTGEIILKRVPFTYKVTLGKTKKNYSNFVDWSAKINKIKMTKTCKTNLCKDRSRGGFYFYVKDDATMSMVKMFVNSDILRIDKIINLTK